MTSTLDDPAAWLDYGREDLEMARRALAPPQPISRSACHHAHQAAEKHLEGFLVARRVRFPRVHDLEFLLRLCVAEDTDFAGLSGPCEVLNEYGVPVRYPQEDAPVPDERQAREALALAEAIAGFVQTRL